MKVANKEHANHQEQQSGDHTRHSSSTVTSGEEPYR